jgi:putative transposase
LPLDGRRMEGIGCSSGAVTERSDLTAQGYRRFRCRDCDQQFKERRGGGLNRSSLPSEIITLVVFCRLRDMLTTAGTEQDHTVAWIYREACAR